MSKIFSLKDVVENSSPDAPWFIIHNNVYNVKELLSKHPGGPDVLKDYAGKDATECFENVGHSSEARKWMKDFQIGSLAGSNNKPWYCYPFYQAALFLGVVGIAVIIGVSIHKIKH